MGILDDVMRKFMSMLWCGNVDKDVIVDYVVLEVMEESNDNLYNFNFKNFDVDFVNRWCWWRDVSKIKLINVFISEFVKN